MSRSQISSRRLKAMSFLREVEGFSVDKLKSVQTRITTSEGRKVKVKLHCNYAHIVKCDPRPTREIIKTSKKRSGERV